jgi:hypothetical protein
MLSCLRFSAALGAKEKINGAWVYVNPASESVPIGVVTNTLPEAPAPVIAVMIVSDCTWKEAPAMPPRFTVVAPVKL